MESQQSCLMGLFKGRQGWLRKQCKASTVPRREQVWRLGHHNYLLYLPSTAVADIYCYKDGQLQLVRSESFQGLKKVRLPRFCILKTPMLSVSSSETLHEAPLVLGVNHEDALGPLMEYQGITPDNEEFVKLFERPAHVEFHDPHFKTITPSLGLTGYLFHPISIATLGISLTLFFAVCFLCKWRKGNGSLNVNVSSTVDWGVFCFWRVPAVN